MAITSCTADVKAPLPGQIVTLSAVITVGTRYRYRLVSKPPASTLELYDADKDSPYLDNNRITPDVAGQYGLECVEETEAATIPRFSNDYANATVTVSVVGSPAACNLCAVERVTRKIGVAPNDCTLEAHAVTYYADMLGSATHGILTAYQDATLCPRLSGAGSTAAEMALRSTAVMRALADIGGLTEGWTTYGSGVRAALETEAIMPRASVIDTAILDSFAYTVKAVNEHILSTALHVHAGADAANNITAADAAVGNATSQVDLHNDILVKLTAHAAVAPAVHHDADTVAAAELALISALAPGASLALRITEWNKLFVALDGHQTRVWLSTAFTSYAHLDVGGMHLNYAAYYPVYDEATLVTCMNLCKIAYELHRVQQAVVAANYHALAGGTDSEYMDTLPTDKDGFVVAVQKLLHIWNSHVTNYNASTGAVELYHTAADFAARTDTIPNPTDYASAVNAFEALRYQIGLHASKGSPTHGSLWAGGVRIWPRGCEAIHHALRAFIQSTTLVTAQNYIVTTNALVQEGGWEISPA